MTLREHLESIPFAYWQNDRVIIRPMKTEADLIWAAYECQLNEDQRELVSPMWFLIGRAYLSREDNYPCIICNRENQPIGFINLCKWIGAGNAYSWSFFIDRHHQGKGLGRSTAELAIALLKFGNPEQPIRLATEVCNEKAQRLYRFLGFQKLPELDGDDLVFGL